MEILFGCTPFTILFIYPKNSNYFAQAVLKKLREKSQKSCTKFTFGDRQRESS